MEKTFRKTHFLALLLYLIADFKAHLIHRIFKIFFTLERSFSLTVKPIQTPYSMSFGLILCAIASFCALFFNSFNVDLGYWQDWTKQFQSGGYAQTNANYPPLLLHWIWLFAQILTHFSMGPDNLILLKIWVVLPVVLAHVLLTALVGKLLIQRKVAPHQSVLFWLTAFNPAILIDGPMWGQVDLLPFFPMAATLWCALKSPLVLWAFPLFTIALLCKFQAIVIVPLLAGLVLKHFKIEWKNILWSFGISLFILCVGFLPFIVSGQFLPALERAYWGNLGMYPFASMNAANLWYILTDGSMRSDKIVLFAGKVATGGTDMLFTPSKLGLILFGLLSLWIFFKALTKINSHTVWFYALLSCFGFFTFSSAMHERYLYMAVPFALLWAVYKKSGLTWAFASTIFVYLNINYIMNIQSDGAWIILSWLTVIACILMIFISLKPTLSFNIWTQLNRLHFKTRWVVLALAFAHFSMVYSYIHKASQMAAPIEFKSELGIPVSDLKPLRAKQGWGDLKMNSNLNGTPLMIHQKQCAFGLGTHASSEIVFAIPEGAKKLKGMAGLDIGPGKNGEVTFSILLDKQEVWSSGMVHSDVSSAFDIDLSNHKELTLIVDKMSQDSYDHSDWCEVYFEK